MNPIGPRGVYDEAKRFAEAMTLAYHRYHGVDTRIVRIFNTYGPRMRLRDGRAVPAFMSQALRGEDVTIFGDGTQTRSFCYVSDLVDGILRLMASTTNDPVNIGNPHELSIEEIARTIVRLVDSKSRLVYRDLPVDDPKQRQPGHHPRQDAPRLGAAASASKKACSTPSATSAASSASSLQAVAATAARRRRLESAPGPLPRSSSSETPVPAVSRPRSK